MTWVEWLLYPIYRSWVGYWIHWATQITPQSRAERMTVRSKPTELSSCTVYPVPIFESNYAYIIIDRDTDVAALVDPADPYVVCRKVTDLGVKLSMSLTTHKHWDHAGGNWILRELLPELDILVPDGELVERNRNMGFSTSVKHGDSIFIGNTRDYVKSEELAEGVKAEAIFTGDFLFAAGAGKFFEGSGQNMANALQTFMSYAGNGQDSTYNTFLFFGHEYTLENLTFAHWLDPSSVPTRHRLERLQTQIRANNGRVCSVPSRFDEEEMTNPYIRCINDEAELARATEKKWRCTPCSLPLKEKLCGGQARTLAKIRTMKDCKCHKSD